ncbi:MAG: hypothetical protein AVDCRST_MAG79-1685 [uncultured Thermoleophilia bacterium]|uniref:SCP domain-containing protein n=1 Tax=uncultured Thermoleophilia bacterium TaxID=1497501 RepID=A0A6J4U3L5_9ACTN|nr:MAG: hypothetical protein AVDCRST_MAG79-1685 [uncultured Thermoleophilia bacterium]
MLLALALLVLTPAAQARSRSQTPVERQVVEALNEVRARHGLGALRVAPGLVQAARSHSRDMLLRDYFSHPSLGGPDFGDRVRRHHPAPVVGENLAWGTGRLRAPAAVVRMWMDSPPHRAIILDREFRVVGVGRSFGTFRGHRRAAVFTADFASR